MKIYTITAIRAIDGPHISGSRVMGFFGKLEEAEEAVLADPNTIYPQGFYPYVVIERVEDGLYPFCPESHWYQWVNDWEGGRYVAIEKPESLRITTNYSMG